jgi:hypothetical protein
VIDEVPDLGGDHMLSHNTLSTASQRSFAPSAALPQPGKLKTLEHEYGQNPVFGDGTPQALQNAHFIFDCVRFCSHSLPISGA